MIVIWRGIMSYLVKDHFDGPVITACWQARGCALSSCRGDIGLGGHGAVRTATAKEALEKLPCDHELAPGCSVTPTATGCSTSGSTSGSTDPAQVVLNSRRRVGTIVGRCRGPAHEVRNHGGGVDGAVALCSAQGANLAAPDLTVTNDGRVGLRAASIAGAVTRCTIGD